MNTGERLIDQKLFRTVVGIIPLLLFTVMLIFIFIKQQEKTILEYLINSAAHASHSVDRAIGEQIGLLYGLSASRSLDNGNFDSFRVNAQRLIEEHAEWRTVILTDDKEPLFNIRFQPGQKITPLRDPLSLKKVWETKKPFIGDLSNGFIAIRTPVIRNDQILYTLVVPVDPDHFLSAAKVLPEENPWGVIIAGSDGIVIAASSQAPASQGSPLPQKYFSSDSSILSLDGMIYTPPCFIAASGWKLILFAPEAAIRAPFENLRMIIYSGGFLTAVLSVILFIALGSAWDARHEAITLRKEISIRLKTETELRHTELALKEAQRLAELGSWQWDVVANHHTWSEEIYRIYGRDPQLPPAIYPEVRKYFTPESWSKLSVSVEEALRNGTPYTCDAEVIREDGSHHWITARGEAVRDNDGNMLALRGTIQNISERKRMEDSLKDSELRYRSLFEHNLDGIAIMEGFPPKFTFVNPAFVELSGYTENEIRGMEGPEIWSLVYPEDVELVRTKLKDRIEGKYASVRYEFRLQRKDGMLRIVEASGTMLNIAGKMINQSFYRDITALKQTEKERALLQEQFIQAQKMESIGRLAGGVAHDFNNLLSVILGYTELAMAEVNKNTPLFADLENVYDAGLRSTEIVKQLLAFSRKQIIQPVVIDLNNSIEKMLKILRRLIGENISLTWSPCTESPLITIDPAQIDQILANLCVNARDAIADIGKITIETHLEHVDDEYCASHLSASPGQYAVLSVSDNGSGMEKDVVDKIFEPFFSTKGALGTGLGLATVYGIVKQNNGYINVYSESAKGTVFKIYLPVSMGNINTDDVSDSGSPLGHGETLLFVDDDASIVRVSRKILQSLGYKILTAETCDEVLSLVKEHTTEIKLLLTDVIMPEMNGKELSQKVLAHNPNLQVIYMSGYTANVIAHHGILEKDIHFIQKPFTRNKIAQIIKTALASKNKGDSKSYG